MGNTARITIDRVMKRVTISAKIPLPLKRKQERRKIMISLLLS